MDIHGDETSLAAWLARYLYPHRYKHRIYEVGWWPAQLVCLQNVALKHKDIRFCCV